MSLYCILSEIESAPVMEWNSLILRSDLNSLLAPGRPNNGGGTPDRVSCLVPSHRAGCTLLGGLRSMSVVTKLGIGGVWSRGNCSHDQQLLVALSQSRPDLS